tara:strand:+ start:195 stop:1349 length:1155 start_codon:yes stop_codon:yes gene_type:complete
MWLKNNWGVQVFLAFVLAIFLLPFSSAGLLEVSVNSSEDLVVSEDETIIQEGTNLNLYVRLKGAYREAGNNNTVESITINVNFRNTEDPRDSLIGYPEYQPLCDTCSDPGYDEYLSKFRSSDTRFKGYDGIVEFDIILRNNSNDIVKSAVVEITLVTQQADSSDSGGFSIPELPPVVEENLIIIAIGFLAILLLSVGIYTFVLAPEDTTADLYKPVESVDPLKKSLTGVGHKSDLPSESKKLKRLEGTGDDSDEEDEKEDDEYEDDFDDEEDDSDFDERKILDELTGTHSIGSQVDEEDDGSDEDGKSIAAAPVKKKAVKKRVAKKGVAKKLVKRPSTKTETSQPEVEAPKGMISVSCPSCSKVHTVDENTTKFICSCGRRIRV